MDFLSDGLREFGLVWDKEAFEKNQLEERRHIQVLKGSEKGWMLI